jgi:hypothetical protein
MKKKWIVGMIERPVYGQAGTVLRGVHPMTSPEKNWIYFRGHCI